VVGWRLAFIHAVTYSDTNVTYYYCILFSPIFFSYPDANEIIDYFLHLNQSGVRNFGEKSSLSEILNFLETHREDQDVTYYLFSENPSLFVCLIKAGYL
jgi:hypothetical protein